MIKRELSAPTRKRLFWPKFAATFFPIFLAASLLGVVSAAVLARQAVSSAIQNSNNMLMQAMQSVEMLFSGVDSVALAICQDTETLDRIGDVFENEEALDRETRLETERFRKFVSSISNSNPYVFSVYVYVNNSHGKFITSIEDGITLLDSFYDRGWYERYYLRRGEAETWTESRTVQRYSFEKPIALISRYRTVYPKGMVDRGVIVENVEKAKIIQMIDSLSLLNGQQLRILDENGMELFSYIQNPEEPTLLGRLLPGSIETRVPSNRFGWTFVSVVPYRVIYRSVSGIFQMLLVILLCGLLFSAALAFIVSQRKYQRVLSVIRAFDNHQPDLAPPSGKRLDEYDYFIGNMFNEYIEKTNLEMTVSTQKYQLRIMEILALQSQINPHFLFNTLEVIKWESIGLTRGENVVSQMLEDLSDIMRHALSDPDELVTLREEIDVSQSYIKILQYRYVDKFAVDWRCDARLLSRYVPKLIFQPLIENSVYHGIKEKPGFCRIRIRIRPQGEGLLLRITDNGVGMTRERLQEVREKLAGELHVDSIGMYNIYKRLTLLYQGTCSIRVFSRENLGTVITIRISDLTERGKTDS